MFLWYTTQDKNKKWLDFICSLDTTHFRPTFLIQRSLGNVFYLLLNLCHKVYFTTTFYLAILNGISGWSRRWWYIYTKWMLNYYCLSLDMKLTRLLWSLCLCPYDQKDKNKLYIRLMMKNINTKIEQRIKKKKILPLHLYEMNVSSKLLPVILTSRHHESGIYTNIPSNVWWACCFRLNTSSIILLVTLSSLLQS